ILAPEMRMVVFLVLIRVVSLCPMEKRTCCSGGEGRHFYHITHIIWYVRLKWKESTGDKSIPQAAASSTTICRIRECFASYMVRLILSPKKHRLARLFSLIAGLDHDRASGPINRHAAPSLDPLGCASYANDGRNAILASHNRAVCHRPTHIHHQSS